MYSETPVRADDRKRSVTTSGRVLKRDLRCSKRLGVRLFSEASRALSGAARRLWGEGSSVENFMTAYELTAKGCGLVADYVGQVREILAWTFLWRSTIWTPRNQQPHQTGKGAGEVQSAWLEDMVPWSRTEEWKVITDSIDVPT